MSGTDNLDRAQSISTKASACEAGQKNQFCLAKQHYI